MKPEQKLVALISAITSVATPSWKLVVETRELIHILESPVISFYVLYES